MLQNRRGRLPRNRRRNDDAQSTNRGRRRDPQDSAGRVDERSAGKAVVHRGRCSDHFVDGSAPPGPQRTADDRNDARARSQGVAPGPGDGQREVADPSRSLRDRRRRRFETARAENDQARCRIPADELGVQLSPVIGPNAQAVLAPEGPCRREHGVASKDNAARRTPPALDLNYRRRNGAHRVGHLRGNRGKCGIAHGPDSARMPPVAHHPNGQGRQERPGLTLRNSTARISLPAKVAELAELVDAQRGFGVSPDRISRNLWPTGSLTLRKWTARITLPRKWRNW